jgi:UDP-N-acetylmuramoylalanine--D-glutamate ligase
MDLRNKKVTIMGLGRHGGGVTAAKYCALSGAIVTVTDLANRATLEDSLAALRDVPIEKLVLGEHRIADFTAADIVVVNPAVKPNNVHVEQARQAGAKITSEIELFLDECLAMVVGVTGTVGKSTTAAMLAEILKAAGRRTWFGGNIGHSLLADLPQISTGDIVVLELSSFQLYWLNDSAHWPQAALVTNCMPNHLDWHGNWEHYVTAKKRLVSHIPADGFVVLNDRDAEANGWRPAGKNVVFSSEYLNQVPPLRVPGEHNRLNAAFATAAAKQLGVGDAAIASALANFAGLPHRLCFVDEIAGRQFYNDSKSTTPAATFAALNAMDRPAWLLLGGSDKNVEWSQLVEHVQHQCHGVAVFGSVSQKLHELFRRAESGTKQSDGKQISCFCCDTLNEAFAAVWKKSSPGDAILLSPGCPSTDQYRDFVHRGEEFTRQVSMLGSVAR